MELITGNLNGTGIYNKGVNLNYVRNALHVHVHVHVQPPFLKDE